MKKEKLNITEIRNRLNSSDEKQQWRSLDELADTKEYQEFLNNEYPHGAANFDEEDSGLSRRDFMKLMGAAFMMASLPGCSPQPLEKIVPYVSRPEEIIPGKPVFFATSMEWNGHATGLLVESHMGRPTKIEGNPNHPDSLGATNAIHQASILSLYDPNRSKDVLHNGAISSWTDFITTLNKLLENSNNGDGVRILTTSIISPTLTSQINAFLQKYPNAKWHQFQSVNKDLARKAQKAVFGKYLDPQYSIDKANIILSINSDFLATDSGSLANARQFSKNRRLTEGQSKMNRLYSLEVSPTLTGAASDHKVSANIGEMIAITEAIASKLGLNISAPSLSKKQQKFVNAVVEDLKHSYGKSLVVVSERSPAYVQALAFAINDKLGNINKTISFIKPIESNPELNIDSLKQLSLDCEQDKVKTLIILDGNPIYTAPFDLNLKNSFSKVTTRIHFGLYNDETAQLANWHIPAAHYLETFSDSRASNGTVSMIQPLIAPLFKGKSIHEFASVLNGIEQSSYDSVYNFWKSQKQSLDFNKFFRTSIHDGLIENTEYPKESVSISPTALYSLKPTVQQGISLTFNPDPAIWDGQFSNNAWLQELPKPFSKLTWDNAALISPSFAEHEGLSNEDIISITVHGKSLNIPVWIVPGHADKTISLYSGYGRTNAGDVGNDKGFNINSIRSYRGFNFATNAAIKLTGKTYKLASTQLHNSMHGRNLVRQTDLTDYIQDPKFAQHLSHGKHFGPSMFDGYVNKGKYAWGMTINTGACIGCNACVTACQSENNIAVVGKDEILNGRELHWIRIDNYFEGDLDNPDIHHQPVMCQQCENAPCEPVCPVGATQHNDEGLNDMVYNRCVGTRYCSNNCPYKVRRFNFYGYSDKTTPTYQLMYNPDVTVRNRGVMEKCTFCVQRINHARIDAEREGRLIQDGEVVTACQSVCPTQAISFGDLKDSKSNVSKIKRHPLNYGILTELNTRPRLTYLAKVKNRNEHLSDQPSHSAGHH